MKRTSLATLQAKAAKGKIAETTIPSEAAPVLAPDFWGDAEIVVPNRPKKVMLSLRLDQDIVEWFRESGPGYQSRMNAILRSYMERKAQG
jgi:uncharacterized protein (DUF4415 family)